MHLSAAISLGAFVLTGLFFHPSAATASPFSKGLTDASGTRLPLIGADYDGPREGWGSGYGYGNPGWNGQGYAPAPRYGYRAYEYPGYRDGRDGYDYGGSEYTRESSPGDIPPAEAVRSTIEQWTRELIDRNFDSWIGFWTDDAMLMLPDHATLHGQDEILSFARDSFATNDDYSIDNWRIEGQGDLAVVATHVRWGKTDFKQMITLRRQADEWKIQMVMLSPGGGS